MSLARATASSGTLIEVSSAGLTERCREIYPSPGLLSAFRDAGVDITMASDTHVPKGAGWGIDLVADHARKAGYTRRAVFRLRQHHSVGLDDGDNSMGHRA